MAATDSCFAPIAAHQRGKAVGLMNGENPRLKKPLTAEVTAKQSIKRQLHTTHMGAVCWEPYSMQFYRDMRGEGGSRVTSKLKKGANSAGVSRR